MYNFTKKALEKRARGSHALKITKWLCISLMIISCNVLLAQTGTEKLSITLSQAPLSNLIKQIETQSNYVVNLVREDIDLSTKVSVNLPPATISEILSEALKNSPYHFTVEKDVITIQRKASKKISGGKITGQVMESIDGEPVIGATIKLGNKGTITDIHGLYTLEIPSGKYSMEISSLGFVSKRINEVVVKENAPTLLNISLSIRKGTLKEVEVVASAKRESIASLYLRQKANAAISDGISAEQISRTPDKNIGEVLKRVTGLTTMDNKYVIVRGLGERYNQAVLNGQVMPSTELNRKNFNFDIIPSNIVENVTVIKTLTPDRNAEFGGGLVEVNTLDIPTENFFNISAGGSYNTNTTGKDFVSLQFDGREYLAQASKHRELFGKLNWESRKDILQAYNSHGNDPATVSNNWGLTRFKAQPGQNYQLSGGHIFKGRNSGQFGILASASYRNSLSTQDIRMSRDGFEAILNPDDPSGEYIGYIGKRYGMTTNLGGVLGIGYKNSRNKIGFQSLYLRTLDQQLQLGGDAPVFGYYDLTTQTSLWQNQLKGEHSLGNKGIKLRWMGSYIQLDRQRPDNHQNTTHASQLKPEDPSDYNINSAMSNGISFGALRWWSRALENNLSWDLSLSVPFNFQIGNLPVNNTIKGGYAGWNKDRLFYVVNAGTNFSTAIYGPPLAKAFSPENGVTFAFDKFGDDFHRTAALHAGYLMLDNKISKRWRLVWGLRAEYYNLNNVNANLDSAIALINSTRNPDKQFDVSAIRSREPNMRFFPSANLTYSLTPAMNLRLAYAQSIIRPDLRELSFFKEYDFELGGVYRATLVRSSLLKHLDFRYEWYPSAGEIVSFSLFYKKIDYPMEVYKQGDHREYELRNNRWAKNYGIELEARKSFAFTKVPVIRNITLFGNFTRLFATVLPMSTSINELDPDNPYKIVPIDVVGKVQKRPQAGASNIMLNAGVYYDTKPVSLSVSYNYISNRMFLPNESYIQSLFERPMKSLDAQLAFHLMKNQLEFKINITNLLNSYSLVYSNLFSGQLDILDGKKAPTTQQLLYKKGESRIDFEAKPGTTLGGTLSYKF
ncbi:TonB-dependent receptor [Chitinophaga silvatica]|uniref:TonB-dependent receptor n=1 Tax=Chitinophaga silvatica TaxID=2282649 RepID=A0A3E1YGW2_9BACT|nr:TonB-dependent receptor [Chitinophaga silvatica]RFS26663.1 TonB-dependent receptor [Chitinophaga silvatica]